MAKPVLNQLTQLKSLRNWLAAIGLSVGAVTGGVYIAGFEGNSPTPYYDLAQTLTVCRGHTGADVIADKTYSAAECDALFASDLKQANDALLRLTAPMQLTHGEHAAYLSFIYNVGQGNFANSTLRQLLLADQRIDACNQLPRWVYAHGIQWPGLAARRAGERQLCLSELIHGNR